MKRGGIVAQLAEWLATRCGRNGFLQDLEDGRSELRRRAGARAADRWHARHAWRSIAPLATEWLRVRGVESARGAAGDARAALRAMRGAPGASVTVVVVLTLGVGISAAVFSTFRAVLLQPLPYERPADLVSVGTFDPTRDASPRGVPGPDFFESILHLDAYSSVAAFESYRAVVGFSDSAVRLEAATMTSSALRMLGLDAVVGRGFTADEDAEVDPAVVMISERLWRQQFEGHEIAGQSLLIDGAPFAIVGVAPADLDLPHERVDLWTPLGTAPARYHRRAPILDVVARLASGATLAGARAEAEVLGEELARRYPETHAARRFHVVPLLQAVSGNQRAPLMVLALGALTLLLIAATNAASLQLGRWTERSGEIAIRRALGATSLHLVRQFICEAAILGTAAAACGFLLASMLLRWIPLVVPAQMPRIETLAMGPAGAVFVVAAALISAVAGAIPSAAQTVVARSSARGPQLPVTATPRKLIVAQVGAAAVLVALSLALLGVLADVLARDRGVDGEDLLLARVDLPATRYPTGMARYPDWPEVQRFHEEVLNALVRESGIVGAALSSSPPAGPAQFRSALQVEGATDEIAAAMQHVSADWSKLIGQRILAGRSLGEADRASSARVAVVNHAFARRLGGVEQALGQRFAAYGSTWEIVGVATDTDAIGQIGAPAVMLPFRQAPVEFIVVVVRTRVDPLQMGGVLRDTIRGLDSQLAVYDVRTMDAFLETRTADVRSLALLIGMFGTAGAVLGAAGVLASLMRSVAARQREIGIRLALGAQRPGVLLAVIGQGTGAVVVGLALSLPIVALTWGQVVSLSPEPAAFPFSRLVLTMAAFVGLAALASLRPAWRAAATDPLLSIKTHCG